MPAAMILLTFFLALCLTMIPLLDSKFVFHGHQTGLEYVHATVLWLCVLTLYIIILQIVKVKVRYHNDSVFFFVINCHDK